MPLWVVRLLERANPLDNIIGIIGRRQSRRLWMTSTGRILVAMPVTGAPWRRRRPPRIVSISPPNDRASAARLAFCLKLPIWKRICRESNRHGLAPFRRFARMERFLEPGFPKRRSLTRPLLGNRLSHLISAGKSPRRDAGRFVANKTNRPETLRRFASLERLGAASFQNPRKPPGLERPWNPLRRPKKRSGQNRALNPGSTPESPVENGYMTNVR